jgi:hypothetical protein
VTDTAEAGGGEAEAAVDDPAPGATRRRRPSKRIALLAVVGLLVLVVAALGWQIEERQPDFAYAEPVEAVAPGRTVVVPATPGHDCGPLFVSLHRQGALGLWHQTHSGNVFDGFHPDARPWWSLGGGSYMTPVPCSIGGETTFTLPDDIAAGVVAACDTGHDCTRIRVGR